MCWYNIIQLAFTCIAIYRSIQYSSISFYLYRDVFRAQLRQKRCYRAPTEGWWRSFDICREVESKGGKAKEAKSLAASTKAFNAFRLSSIGPSLKTLHEKDEEDLLREKVTSRVRLIAKTIHWNAIEVGLNVKNVVSLPHQNSFNIYLLLEGTIWRKKAQHLIGKLKP